MSIAIIAAMSRNRVIGKEGAIPWHIPADLRRFRELTLGHTVIMGRRTFESIGRPLPWRRNVVVTGQKNYAREDTLVVHSLMEAVASADPAEELFICGGSEIYRQALAICSKIYLTVVDLDVSGDSFFPHIPADAFREVSRETISERPPAQFIVLEKLIPSPGEYHG